ncbi:MAG: DUF6934 family protein [Spirosomataceae bacterium]
MKQQYYKYLRDEDCLWFEFESVSNQKTVRKIVVYTPFQDNPDVFNLALADALSDGSYSDKTVTNNEDMEKVMATVIRTMLRFFEKYPTKMVYVEGSTAERTRLYRIIISRELSEIEKIFTMNLFRILYLCLFFLENRLQKR